MLPKNKQGNTNSAQDKNTDMAKMKKSEKFVYFFGGGKADGNESMKNLLGGKGANLAEMAGHPALKLPVPPGFTVTTEVCTYYYDNKRSYPKELTAQVNAAVEKMEKLGKKQFGSAQNPLLLSVRSATTSFSAIRASSA